MADSFCSNKYSAAWRVLNDSLDDAQVHFENNQEKYSHHVSMSKFLKKSDNVEMVLHYIIGKILSIPLTIESDSVMISDLEDMKQAFSLLGQVLLINFFSRSMHTFRVLRCFLTLHLINSVEEYIRSSLRLRRDFQNNPRLNELGCSLIC